MSKERHPALRVLAVPGYRRLVGAASLYALGRWLEQLTVGWFVLQATGSVFLTALTWAVRALPNLLFGSIAGAIADRHPRNRLLSLTALARAANVFAMAGVALLLDVTGEAKAWLILALLGISGIGNTVQIASTPTLAVDNAGERDRSHAISTLTFAARAIGVVGVLAGGFVLAAVGPGWTLVIAGVPWLLAAALFESVPAPAPSAGAREPGLLRVVIEGLRVLSRIPAVTRLLGLMVAAEVFGFSFSAFTPVIAEQRLGVGAEGLGGLMSAIALGAMMGVGLLSAARSAQGRGRLLLAVVMSFGVLVAVLPFSTVFALSLAVMALLGACAALIDTLQWELLQRSVPDDLRGRVIGAWNVAIGLGILGPVLIGALAEWTGITVALGVAGATLAVVGAIATRSGVIKAVG